ncbi:hypothetical protein AGATL06_23690 [Agathobaculum sp. TL06]
MTVHRFSKKASGFWARSLLLFADCSDQRRRERYPHAGKWFAAAAGSVVDGMEDEQAVRFRAKCALCRYLGQF